jgi:hypothetical protein
MKPLTTIVILAIAFSAACNKEEKVIPQPVEPPPTEITVKAVVPSVLYSNKKEIILDCSPTLKLNGYRTLKFLWTCTSFPSGKQPAIFYPESSSTNVKNIDTGKYVFNLKVTDNLGNQNNSDYALVVYPDTLTGPPVLPPMQNMVFMIPEPVLLFSSNVTEVNPADRKLRFKWTLLEQPPGSPVVDIRSPSFSFTEVKGCIPGKYTFKLELTNELELSTSGTVQVTLMADSLAGTTRIYDNLAWTEYYDDIDGSTIIALDVHDPQISFAYRNSSNTEISIWDYDMENWMAPNFMFWGGYQGGFFVYNNIKWPGIYPKTIAKVRVKFL